MLGEQHGRWLGVQVELHQFCLSALESLNYRSLLDNYHEIDSASSDFQFAGLIQSNPLVIHTSYVRFAGRGATEDGIRISGASLRGDYRPGDQFSV